MPNNQTRRSFIQQSAAAAFAVAGAGSLRATQAAEKKKDFRGKFSICNETFRDWEFPKAFAFAAECGYQGIEVAPFTISDYVTDISAHKRQEFRKQAEKEGLQITGLHWLLARTKGLHLTSPDQEIRKNTAKYLGELARFSADLGGKLIVFGSPRQRSLMEGVSREKGLQYAAEVIREALPVLEKADVKIALEPLSPKITNFMSTAAEAVEVIKLVDSPRCRLILDCVAMSTESTPIPDLVRKYKSRMVHFHANDPNSQGPGFGKLDFVPIFAALREVDFNGWVSVEVFNYKPGPERLARESIEYMKKCVAKTA